MSKETLIKRTFNTLSKLPQDKVKEVSDYLRWDRCAKFCWFHIKKVRWRNSAKRNWKISQQLENVWIFKGWRGFVYCWRFERNIL